MRKKLRQKRARGRRHARRFNEYERVEAAKYRPAVPASPASVEQGELPESYGQTKVVAMPVNPYLVHVYWDLDPKLASPDTPTAGAGCLRFSDTTTGEPPGSFDVKVDLAARNWYVHLWSPERRYVVQLGLSAEGGAFVPLARSNVVETPRAWPVADVEEQFVRVGEGQQPLKIVPPPPPALASVPAITALTPPGGLTWIRPPASEASAPPAATGQPKPIAPAASVPRAATASEPPAVSRPAADARPAPTSEKGVGTPSPRSPAAAIPPTSERPTASAAAGPVSAAAVLFQRLTELYALRWREQPVRHVTAAPSVTPDTFLTLDRAVTADRRAAIEALLPVRPEAVGDLTALAERQFSPGFSSSLLALQGSRQRAG